MAPHEALIFTSQILPGEALVYINPGMYKMHSSLQVYMFFNEEEIRTGIARFQPGTICVSFNEPKLDEALVE